MTYEGQIAETITIRGHNGDQIEAYYARPQGAGPFPGVVLIHHMPGWDEWTKEVVRRFAHHGYCCISPHLFSRHGPGTAAELATRGRESGGMRDSEVMGDVSASIDLLRMQPQANGRIGIIGFCSGGRHTYLAACTMDGIDAAVDCWGGNVILDDASALNEMRPVAPITLTAQMRAPLLGIFGNDDQNPTVAHVNATEEELKKHGKTYEFHRYDGAGHGFFSWERPAYRQEQAGDAWQQIWAFYGKYLATPVPELAAAR